MQAIDLLENRKFSDTHAHAEPLYVDKNEIYDFAVNRIAGTDGAMYAVDPGDVGLTLKLASSA